MFSHLFYKTLYFGESTWAFWFYFYGLVVFLATVLLLLASILFATVALNVVFCYI